MINNSNSKDVIWLDTFSDLVAGVKAFNQCMTTADVMSDEDWRLVCADTNSNLKVFKGNILQNEAKLHYTPVGIVSFYAPDTNGRNCVPYVAVAGGSYIFIYKNLKGAYKFCLPNIEPNEDEVQIWNELKENKIDCKSARSKLVDLNKNSKRLFYFFFS